VDISSPSFIAKSLYVTVIAITVMAEWVVTFCINHRHLPGFSCGNSKIAAHPSIVNQENVIFLMDNSDDTGYIRQVNTTIVLWSYPTLHI